MERVNLFIYFNIPGAAFLQHAARRVGRTAAAGVQGLQRDATTHHLQIPAQKREVGF